MIIEELKDKIESIEELRFSRFSLYAKTKDEVDELFKAAQSLGLKWYTSDPIKLEDETYKSFFEEKEKIPEGILEMNFCYGFNRDRQLGIYCTWAFKKN